MKAPLLMALVMFPVLAPAAVLVASNPSPAGAQTPKADSTEIAFWQSIDRYDPAQLNEYLATYPNGAFAGLARLRLKEIAKENEQRNKLDALTHQMETMTPQQQRQPSTPPSPLSVSELDLVKQQIEQCWNVPVGARNAQNLTPKFIVSMNSDGTVRSATLINPQQSSDPYFQAAADSARKALFNQACQPLKLPPQKYKLWQTFTITFDPKDLS